MLQVAPFLNSLLENTYFKYFFPVFCLLILINGSNFIDGLNGLMLGYFSSIILLIFYFNLYLYLEIDETFLMNLFRGTHLHGLRSIPKNINKIKRPLLDVSKEEIIKYAKVNQINYLDDESNFDNAINRNWIRN